MKKASEYIHDQLQHKARTVEDLIKYIGTRDSNDTCNYSLLLGAGASVTSGIRTGGQLVSEWSKELYERYTGSKSLNPEEIENYLSTKQGHWYNPLNKYSSLFERKFDLPSQRRRFVEKEVDGKLPSIGYAYLTGICEENYLNTIFTTNFDDLINEAFYQFTNIRPIHCAHDSSVASISISSKRPKIIKIHGDYLFDDIKSTLRETESLETNTRQKFSEFCKEYGLIVLGYAGNDRSVMDVLEFLSKQENYLSNGIYWCLREDDIINQNLQNLLWKDKVYPVIIKSFDETLAKLHHSLCPDSIKITPNPTESKLRKTIDYILEDRFTLSTIPEIKKDIDHLRNESDISDMSILISDLTFNGNNDNNQSFRKSTLKEMIEIDSQIKNGDLNIAYTLAEKCYKKSSDTDQQEQFLRKLISISKKTGDDHLQNKWLRKLIESDPNNPGFILYYCDNLDGIDEKINYLKGIIDKGLVRYQILYKLGLLFSSKSRMACSEDEKIELLKESIKSLNKSITLEPSPDNNSWIIIFERLIELHLRTKDSDTLEQLQTLYQKIKTTNKFKKSYLNINIQLCTSGIKEVEEICDFSARKLIDESTLIYQKMQRNEQETTSSSLLNFASRKLYNTENLSTLKQLFNSSIANDHLDSAHNKIKHAEYELYVNANIIEAENLIRRSLLDEDFEYYICDCLKLSEIVGKSLFEDLKIKFQKISKSLDQRTIDECNIEIFTQEGKYTEAGELLEKLAEEENFSGYMAVSRTYNYILSKDYKSAIDLAESVTSTIDSEDIDAIQINKLFAKQLDNTNFTSQERTKLQNIMAHSKSFGAKACAEILLGQTQQAKANLASAIEKNIFEIYTIPKWPIITSQDLIDGALKVASSRSGIKFNESLTKIRAPSHQVTYQSAG